MSITGMWPVFRWVIARPPRQPVPLRRAMHAAWFGAIGFEILKQAFAIYLDRTVSPPAHGKLDRKNLPAPAPSGPWSASVLGSTAGCSAADP